MPFRDRERERELHLSSHPRLMQVLPGDPLADPEYTIRGSELHVRQILFVTARGLKDRKAFRHTIQYTAERQSARGDARSSLYVKTRQDNRVPR